MQQNSFGIRGGIIIFKLQLLRNSPGDSALRGYSDNSPQFCALLNEMIRAQLAGENTRARYCQKHPRFCSNAWSRYFSAPLPFSASVTSTAEADLPLRMRLRRGSYSGWVWCPAGNSLTRAPCSMICFAKLVFFRRINRIQPASRDGNSAAPGFQRRVWADSIDTAG